jgi:hypothetical protein
LNDEDDDEGGDHECENQIAEQETRFRPEIVALGLFRLVYLNVFVVVDVNATEWWRTAFSNSKHIP